MAEDETSEAIKALEEALVECVDWNRRQDVVDDNRAPESSWIRDGEVVVTDPWGDQYELDSLKTHIEETFDLLARCEALLGEERLQKARSRDRLRRRFGRSEGGS